MNNIEKKNNLIIMILLVMALLFAVKIHKIFTYVGYASIIILTIICFVKMLKGKLIIDKVLITGLIFIIYNIFILLNNFSMKALYVVAQECVLILFFLVFSQNKMEEKSCKKITDFFGKMYYICLVCIVIIDKFNFTNVISITVFKAVFAISFFANIKTKKKLKFTIISSIIFFISGERTSAIICLMMYFLFFIIKKIKSKRLYKVIFIIFTILLVMFPKIYVWMQYEPIGITLNEYSMKISGENFFSGRNRIWTVIFKELDEYKIFGLSYNNDILKSNNINMSTHNLYIWLQMNGGYILLVLYLIMLYTIWMKFYEKKQYDEVALASTYLLGFMLLSSFELLWLSNNFVVSIYMWFVIAMGLINNKRIEKNI